MTKDNLDVTEFAVAQAIFDEHHYLHEKPIKGHLAEQHPDDVERACRQARSAIAAMQSAREPKPGDVTKRETQIWDDAIECAAALSEAHDHSGDIAKAIRSLLSTGDLAAFKPRPASPPTGDVIEAITAWLYAREGGVSFDQLYPMEQEGWRRQAREVAALATLQPADPKVSSDVVDRGELIAALIAEKDSCQLADSVNIRLGLQTAIAIVRGHPATLRASDPSRELVEAWQPIETAPKDGSFILIAGGNFDGGQAVVQWDDGFDNWTLDDGKNPEIAVRNERRLTHWRPLLDAPRAALAQGQSR